MEGHLDRLPFDIFFSFAWKAVPLDCLLQQAMDTGNLLSPESQQNNFVLHAVVIWLLTCVRAHAQRYQPSCMSHGPRWLRCSSLCRFHLNNSYLREQIHITLYHSNMDIKHFNKASTKLKLAAFYMRWIQYETRKKQLIRLDYKIPNMYPLPFVASYLTEKKK